MCDLARLRSTVPCSTVQQAVLVCACMYDDLAASAGNDGHGSLCDSPNEAALSASGSGTSAARRRASRRQATKEALDVQIAAGNTFVANAGSTASTVAAAEREGDGVAGT
jgi:hypothetical protein